MARFIIYGGSFDPIHNGHLRIAKAASMRLNADVIFVPAKAPRWKEAPTDAKHRVKMMKLVLRRYAPTGSRISKFELDNGAEVNYSIDTVRYFIKKHKRDQFFLLIGADQVNRFPEWKNAAELSRLTTIVYVNRPGIELNKDIIRDYNMMSLEFFESGEVSSSDVRDGKSLDIPAEVLSYIEKNELYFINTVKKYVDEKRLLHSIEVAKLSYRIALANKLENPSNYYFAGLFHDIGKLANQGKINANAFMAEHFPEYVDLPKFAYHQFIGAYIVKNELGIDDPDILDAIEYHCTGKANMSKLGMVVYAADKIEPTRQFDSRFLINSCLKNWYQGFIDTLTDNRKYLLAHAKDIENKLTYECFKMYLKD